LAEEKRKKKQNERKKADCAACIEVKTSVVSRTAVWVDRLMWSVTVRQTV